MNLFTREQRNGLGRYDAAELETAPTTFESPEDVIEWERSERSADVIDKWWYRDREDQGVLLRYRLQATDSDVILQTTLNGEHWVSGWPPTKKVPLYRVNEGLGQSPVFLVEGEYAADAAIDAGLSAVTSAGGTDDVERTDWRLLAGREVIATPANSDQGWAYIRAAARMVLALEPRPTVRTLKLPGLEEGEDIGSYLRQSKLAPEALVEHMIKLARQRPGIKPADLAGGPIMEPFRHIPPKPLRWLWPGRVPIGKPMAIFGGCNPGKSLLALDLAARVSAGAPWPDGCGNAPSGKVLLMCRDDHLADTVRPRLDRAGANADQIAALNTVFRVVGGRDVRRGITLGDLDDLERAIEIGGNVRLIIIDPLPAFLGGNLLSRRQIRPVLGGLTALADRHELAIIIVAEMGGRDGLGYGANMALMSAVRSAWLLAPVPGPADQILFRNSEDPRINSCRDLPHAETGVCDGPDRRAEHLPNFDPDRRTLRPRRDKCSSYDTEQMLLLPIKAGVGQLPGGLALGIGEDGIAWDPSPLHPDHAKKALESELALGEAGLANESSPHQSYGPKPVMRTTASEWLQAQLASGPVAVGNDSCPAGTLRAAAMSAGIAWSTVRRAFKELNGVKRRDTASRKQFWSLPIQTTTAKNDDTNNEVPG